MRTISLLESQYRYRVVTLEGDVVNPGGSMTGGSLQKKVANLLGRQRQIEELDAEIETTEQQLALRATISDLRKEQSTDESEGRTARDKVSSSVLRSSKFVRNSTA